MITEIILPQLGDTMNEGTIQSWSKKVGERVEKGDVLFEVLTDKVSMQVEATTTGYLREIHRQENETVPVGEVIGIITTSLEEQLVGGQKLEVKSEKLEAGNRTIDDRRQTMERSFMSSVVQSPSSNVKRFASPRARRLADESDVDLSLVTPTGSNGKRIVEADVLRFVQEQGEKSGAARDDGRKLQDVTPASRDQSITHSQLMTGLRRVIAERMHASAQQTAPVTLFAEADATALVELRDDLNVRVPDAKFTYTDLFVMIAAKALVKHPYMNRTFDQGGLHDHASAHVGVAVDTERGLFVPVIRDAQMKGLSEISRQIKDLSQQVRAGTVSPQHLSDSTFTITNLGVYEIDAFTPIINLPETAILGIGQIVLKPANHEGQLALRHLVSLSLTFDHRLVDGAPAARFLQDIRRFVEAPSLILV